MRSIGLVEVGRGAVPGGVAPALLTATLLAAVEVVGTGTGHAPEWEHGERTEMLRAIDRATAILTASRGRVLRAEDTAGTWSAKGDPSVSRWDGRVSRTGRSGGARRTRCQCPMRRTTSAPLPVWPSVC